MISVDVTYACHLKPGDLYAGHVVPDAPTRPVQEFAAAHKITNVTPFTDDDGRKWLHITAGLNDLTPVRTTTQCLVIRMT